MVKFDIVSGFLGAGKTTLIRQILKSVKDEKVVIIENEYGETQIDKDVLSVAGFDIYELTNGCICCSLKADFHLTLKQILEQKVDRIIFEPSGIFILGEIFDLFKDLQISSRCSLNNIITVVDALQFNKHINSFSGLFVNQIELASALVVSKAQYADTEEVKKVVEELKNINSSAPITVLYDEKLSQEEVFKLLNLEPETNSIFISHNDHHSHGDENHSFDSIGMETDRIFTNNEIEEILEKVVQGHFGNIIRAKGVVKSEKSYLQFNYVDGFYDIEKIEDGIRAAVSFIGTDIDKTKIKALFT